MSALALDRNLSVSQYLHTAWTQEEGSALPGIQAMAQTSEGYIWLGTKQGLIRFDGVRFVRWEPNFGENLPGRDIYSLLPASKGGLWVSSDAGICRLDRTHVIRYPAADRLMPGGALSMMEDSAGELWTIGSHDGRTSLVVMRPDGSAQLYGPVDGLPPARILSIYQEKPLQLWIGTETGVCQWWPGTRAVCSASGPVRATAITGGAAGELLVINGSGGGILRFRAGVLEPAASHLGNISLSPRFLLRDHDGNVWIGTIGQGLLRLRDGRLERFTRRDGLSSDMVAAILEDHEGNVWVGTATGIDRFRGPEIQRLSSVEGLSSDVIASVCAAPDGSIWIGTIGGGLNHVFSGGIQQYLMDSGLPSTTVLSLYMEPEGRLWAGTTAGLAHLSGDSFHPVDGPAGTPLKEVFAVSGDRAGTIWLVDSKAGLVAVRNGVASVVAVPGVPP
jgi:ligand-binding sensor domain-containing protein